MGLDRYNVNIVHLIRDAVQYFYILSVQSKEYFLSTKLYMTVL